jgi:hypothetical protein
MRNVKPYGIKGIILEIEGYIKRFFTSF